MAHQLDNTDGKVSYADSQSDAWHRLGQVVGEKMTTEQALDAAFMSGWNVRKVPLTDVIATDPATGEKVTFTVPDKFATIRTNPQRPDQVDGLGVVGRVWTPFQNEATSELLADITDITGAHVETIGALRGGRDTFITMLLPDHMEFRSPVTGLLDKTALYIAILNNHTGEFPLRALISPIRIVCANTQRMAESNAKSTAVLRHTGEPAKRLAEIRAMLGLTFAYRDAFSEAAEKMIAAERDDEFVKGVLFDVFGVNDAPSERAQAGRIERATQVLEVYRQSVTVAPFKGTLFGAYNAVTEYVDHIMPVGRKGNEATQRAMRTLTNPDAADLKAKAFTKLLPA